MEIRIRLQQIIKELDSLQADKLHFKTLDGLVCEGWITELKEKSFLFLSSGPLAQDEEIEFELTQLDFDSISYYDKEAGKWIEVSA